MATRTCDKCGARMTPRWPRKNVGGEMWCPSCAEAASHVQRTSAARHPDLDESLRVHGTVHTTGGRVLRNHHLAEGETTEQRLHPDHPGWKLHVAYSPVHAAIEGARAFARQKGLTDPHQGSYEHVMQTPDRVRDIGRHYDSMQSFDHKAVPHYHAMRDEVNQQYDHLTGRMGIKVHVTDHDPYSDVHEMAHDLQHNKTIKVLGTHATGGHPVFTHEENDRFRAVHDVFGHAAAGRSFDRHGEEAAYRAHSQMFSEHARPALATETRGQNASLISNGRFAEQKIGLLLPHHHQMTLPHAAMLMARYAAGWSGEDVIRHELGRQKVHTVNGEHQLCPEHLRVRRSQDDFSTGLAAQVGLSRSFSAPSISPPHEGRCTDCSRVGTGKELPWESGHRPGMPVQRSDVRPTEHIDTDEHYQRGRWPYRPLNDNRTERFAPVDTTIRSLNGRVAVAERAQDRPWPGIRVQAHDSGDGETIFHCPFCGSGQVIARSDGTVECEFCSTAFTVQVQPQMPAFPQTIDGMPVDVPGMPAGGQNANVPPGAAPMGPEGPGGDPGAVSGPPGEEPEEEDEPDDAPPPFQKGSLLLRTGTGAVLDERQYVRHLALAHARDRDAVLAQIRHENGAG